MKALLISEGDVTKDQLMDFEAQVAALYDAGKIKAPIHLSGGSESQLIDIFKGIKRMDWVLSTWRSHYHALLHGIAPDELMAQILRGRSMFINSASHHFYSSSIAGGILPIAVGLGMAIKRCGESRNVWCFVGDMTCMTGIFDECSRYAFNFDLPVNFIVEDNGKSVQTDTRAIWGTKNPPWGAPKDLLGNVKYYRYDLSYTHHGVGKWISF